MIAHFIPDIGGFVPSNTYKAPPSCRIYFGHFVNADKGFRVKF